MWEDTFAGEGCKDGLAADAGRHGLEDVQPHPPRNEVSCSITPLACYVLLIDCLQQPAQILSWRQAWAMPGVGKAWHLNCQTLHLLASLTCQTTLDQLICEADESALGLVALPDVLRLAGEEPADMRKVTKMADDVIT